MTCTACCLSSRLYTGGTRLVLHAFSLISSKPPIEKFTFVSKNAAYRTSYSTTFSYSKIWS